MSIFLSFLCSLFKMGQEKNTQTWILIAKKLVGEASPDELKELEELLKAHPELYYSLQTIADFWKPSNPGDQAETKLALDRHLDRMREQGFFSDPAIEDAPISGQVDSEDPYPVIRSRRRLLFWGIPLSVLSVGTALFLFRQPAPAKTVATAGLPGEWKEVITRVGSRTSMVLPDSTHVWLNAGSRISYEKSFGQQVREVSLTGEALFDVAHNPAKPFIIHTDRVDIRVLGTRFNVRSYPTDKTTEATLIRGSIEISIKARPSEKILLKPNEKLVVANDDSALHRNFPHVSRPGLSESLVSIRKPGYEAITGAMIETSWVDDRLAFQDEEFGTLVKEMERWYGVTIQFSQPEMEGWRFTGSFQKETIQQALEALKLTAPFTYTIHQNQITLYNK